jgi:hypothetical protein
MRVAFLIRLAIRSAPSHCSKPMHADPITQEQERLSLRVRIALMSGTSSLPG